MADIMLTKIVTFYLNDSAYDRQISNINFRGPSRPVLRKCWIDMAMFSGFTLQDKQFCYRKSKSGVCPARLQTMQTFAYHLSTDLSLVHWHHVRSERPIKSWKGEFCLSSLKMVNSLYYSVWVLTLVCFTDFNTASCGDQHWQPEREIFI